jgi:hypothetical protein
VASVSAGKRQTRANPKPQSAKRCLHPMGLGAGSWSQASHTARLPPWLASDAGLPYQIGGPTTEAAKRLPRVWATMRRLMMLPNAYGQVGSRWRVCSSVLVRDGAGFGGSEAQELLPMAAIADSLAPVHSPRPCIAWPDAIHLGRTAFS